MKKLLVTLGIVSAITICIGCGDAERNQGRDGRQSWTSPSGLISDCKIVTIELDHIKHEYIAYSRCIVHYPECSFCKAKNDIRNYKNMKDFDPRFDNDDSWKTNTYSKMNPEIMYTVFKDSKLDISELRTDVFIDLVNYCKRHNIKDPRFDIETYKGK